MRPDNQRGAITVFLSIIILATVIFAGVLVDGARIRTGETQVKRAVESAVKSTLAGYDNPLKQRYGIFALHENSPENLEKTIKKYINLNLTSDLSKNKADMFDETYDYLKGLITSDGKFKEARFLNPYDYKIEEVKVTPIFNLTENQVTRNQIVEFMKYRAPKQVLEGFWGKVQAMGDTGKVAEISELKMQIDKLYIDIIKDQETLKNTVDEINTFSYSKLNSYVKPYLSAVNTVRRCKKAIEEINEAIEAASKKDPPNEDALESLYEAKSRLEEKEAKASEERDQNYNLLKPYLEKYRMLNLEAVPVSIRLKYSVIEIKQKISVLKEYTKNQVNASSSSYLKDLSQDILRGTTDDSKSHSIEAIEKNLPDEADVNKAVTDLEFNKKITSYVTEEVKSFHDMYADSIQHGDPEADVSPYILPKVEQLKEYMNKVYIGRLIQEKWTGGSAVGQDSRDDAAKEAKDILEPKEDEKESLLKLHEKELPSYKKGNTYPNKEISKDFSKEDEDFRKRYETFSGGGKSGNNEQPGDTSGDVLNNLNNEINLDNNNFFTKAFDTVKKIGNAVKDFAYKGMLSCRDELYINEYIIGTFNNAVPELKDKTSTANDLRGNPKDKTIKYEVEYILCGSTSENFNLNFIKGQILLIRFAVDTINIYRDPVKVRTALAMATAISGSWSFGLAVPIVHNLIICGWGMKDAVTDLNKLMDGAHVPLFKKYDPVNTAKSEITFSYHDYLRIFLLIEPKEQKMNRIEDLIQVKSGKKISDVNTYLRIEATVSMRYLFMTQAFIPGEFKTPDGARHKFKVVMYQGY